MEKRAQHEPVGPSVPLTSRKKKRQSMDMYGLLWKRPEAHTLKKSETRCTG